MCNDIGAAVAALALPGHVTVRVWESWAGVWFWDDAEDHGGFDRISPMGPHTSKQSAMDHATQCFNGMRLTFEDGKPDHYGPEYD